jgi:ClpP class serine protease
VIDVEHRYERQGFLAVNPQAFFDLFFDPPEPPRVQIINDVAIVRFAGPLEFKAGYWCDSYEAILARVDEACASSAKAVCLVCDSPGGIVSGCFDAARAIRRRCEAAGKRLGAYVEGTGCSAAYALICAADTIAASETAIVGSIGVISSRLDWTELNAKVGIRVVVTASGVRKPDGHPDVPIGAEELAATQALINSLGGAFADLVSELRGIGADEVLALEAGIFTGAEAVTKGLVDRVETLESMLAYLVSDPPKDKKKMTTKASIESIRSALKAMAEGEGAEAEEAKRMLSSAEEPAEPEEEKEEPEAASDKGEEKDDEPFDKSKDPPKEEDDKAAAKVAALQARTAKTAVEGELADIKAELKAMKDEKRDGEIRAYVAKQWKAAGRVNADGTLRLSNEDHEEIVALAKAAGEGWSKRIDSVLRLVNEPPKGMVSNPDASTPRSGGPADIGAAIECVKASIISEAAKAGKPRPGRVELRRLSYARAKAEFPELFREDALKVLPQAT